MLSIDSQDRVRMVIALNPAQGQLEVLEKIARLRPSVRGREAEMDRPGFSLAGLIS
jgi:hypothetical protein